MDNSNEVVNYYPIISAQETKNTNKQTIKKTKLPTNLNRLM